MLHAHDLGEITPAFQLLVYPMLDDRTVLRTDLDTRHVRVWTPGSNRFGWASYLGTEPGGPEVSEYAAPARREDLRGLPPTWIGVGTLDLFHDEDVSYAARLSEAGVPCEPSSSTARSTGSTRCSRRRACRTTSGASRLGRCGPGSSYPDPMEFAFSGELWFWRGPAPVALRERARRRVRRDRAVAAVVTYGWGMIPVTVRIGASEWTTSLWPKDGGYIVPVKAWVREAERLEVGDRVEVALAIAIGGRA